MAASEFESVCQLISKYKFVSANDSLNEDLICVICKGLMIDACQSLCVCRYCYKCVSDYIGDEEKYCPGRKEDCKEVPLVLGVNVHRNPFLNKRISKLKVNCPNESCVCNIELIQLGNHLRSCTKQPIQCPFVPIGCINERANKDAIVTHLSQETLPHTYLLMEWILNLKSEMDVLRQKMEVDSVNKENRIEILEREVVNKENRIEILERELSEVRNESEIGVNGERAEREREMAVHRGDIDGVRMTVNDVRNNVDEMREEREKRINKLIKWNNLLYAIIDADFVWRIEQCFTKMGTDIFSESFYAKNYKLCLRLYIGRDTIALQCYIVRGDNDDRVAWPMRQSVTLSIIDQCTLSPHKSETYKYDTFGGDKSAFGKPTKDRNVLSIGSYPFMKYSSIKDVPSITVNDCIVVSCLLTPP